AGAGNSDEPRRARAPAHTAPSGAATARAASPRISNGTIAAPRATATSTQVEKDRTSTRTITSESGSHRTSPSTPQSTWTSRLRSECTRSPSLGRLRRKAGRPHDVLDLPPMQIEVEPHERQPLKSVPRARHGMRRHDSRGIQPLERRGQRLEERLVAAERDDPVGERPATPRRRGIRRLLPLRPRLRHDALDGLAAMNVLSTPDRLAPPETIGGGPDAVHA